MPKFLRLLIIEDDDDHAFMLVRALTRGGLEVFHERVDTLQSLMEALDASPWGAIIPDYSLPGFSGLDALRTVRAKGLDIPFILVSGVIGEEAAVEVMKAGAHDFILKRNLARLTPALERELQETEIRRERRKAVEALQRAHDELEERVRNRTSELVATNAALQAEIMERWQAEKKILSYQEELRSLSSELLLTEERERRRISVAIHDQIGQPLALVNLRLGALKKLAESEGFAGSFDEVRSLVNQVIEHSRSLNYELSPPILYEAGLEAALASLASNFSKEYGLTVEFHCDRRQKQLTGNISVLLFQAVRELLVNAVKHASPRKVVVISRKSKNNIMILVEDDGIGFDYHAFADGGNIKSFGLFSLRERLTHLEGSLEVETAPGRGTRITLRSPLNK